MVVDRCPFGAIGGTKFGLSLDGLVSPVAGTIPEAQPHGTGCRGVLQVVSPPQAPFAFPLQCRTELSLDQEVGFWLRKTAKEPPRAWCYLAYGSQRERVMPGVWMRRCLRGKKLGKLPSIFWTVAACATSRRGASQPTADCFSTDNQSDCSVCVVKSNGAISILLLCERAFTKVVSEQLGLVRYGPDTWAQQTAMPCFVSLRLGGLHSNSILALSILFLLKGELTCKMAMC